MDFFAKLFDTSGFPARWHCGTWSDGLGYLHIISDVVIWAAYVTIPFILAGFVIKRHDIPFRRIFWLFGAFILACGTGHLIEAGIFWWPAYRLAGAVKLVTALASVGTVVALVPIVPKMLALRSPESLEREIEERKRAEQALRESEERFRLLVEGVKDYALYTLDAQGRIATWNSGARQLNGYESDEVIGKHFSIFYTEEDRRDGRPEQALRLAEKNGRMEEFGWRVRKNGTKFWSDGVLTALRDDHGQLKGFARMTRDVTDRKKVEEALRLQSEIVANMAEGVCLIRATDNMIVHTSPSFDRMFGYESGELIGQPSVVLNAIDQSTNGEATQKITESVRMVGVWSGDVRNVKKDGSQFWCRVNVSAFDHPDHGRVWIAVHSDITDYKRSEEIARRSERLAAIGEVVAGLAHESRNALQQIQSCTGILKIKMQGQPQELRDLIDGVQRAQDRLHRLFDDIRWYAAPIKLDCKIRNVAEIWRESWQQLARQREGRNVRFLERLNGGDNDCLVDPLRLEQAFRNILENSLAAMSDPSQIQVECRPACLDGKPALAVAIRDNGPGFDIKVGDRVFEPFYTTKTHGTGLGMSIVKRVVEAHGGEVSINLSYREGAEVLITLPRGKV